MLVSFLLALPVTASAPITPDEPPLSSKQMVAFATQQAVEAHISPSTVLSVISCESSWDIHAVGDHGTSFGLVQIHLPAHPDVTREMAEDPEFAISFLVRNLAEGNGDMWSCFKMLN